MSDNNGGKLSEILSPEELAAREVCLGFGLDIARTYQFWEHAVARFTTGTVTSHTCPWDVELPFGTETVLIEVKFSSEFLMSYGTGERWVFKWATPAGVGANPKASHVTVLIGIDASDEVHVWVVPSSYFTSGPTSITLTSPRARSANRNHSRSPVNAFQVPFGQMLPEILRAYRREMGS